MVELASAKKKDVDLLESGDEACRMLKVMLRSQDARLVREEQAEVVAQLVHSYRAMSKQLAEHFPIPIAETQI